MTYCIIGKCGEKSPASNNLFTNIAQKRTMLRIVTSVILIFSSIYGCTQIKEKENTPLKSNKIISDSTVTNNRGSIITFPAKTFTVGKVAKDSILTHQFKFINAGDKPLLITKVRTSCNCTVASYNKTPILPGQTDSITINLDTKKPGKFEKVVAVYSNASNNFAEDVEMSRTILHINWIVITKGSTKTR